MHEPIPSTLPADLAAARKRFVAWRTVRRIGARIPEPLWQSAAELAKSYGVSRVSQTLQVDYYGLRRRVDPTSANDCPKRRQSKDPASSAPGFVELPSLSALPSTECQVEFEDGKGARLLLRWKGTDAPDVSTLSHNFWDRD